MSIAEIIIRTQDQEDAIVIANAISNGMERVGFDNVSTSIVGATDLRDPELIAAMNIINPELTALAVDITFEAIPSIEAVDPVVEDGFEVPEDVEVESEDDDD